MKQYFVFLILLSLFVLPIEANSGPVVETGVTGSDVLIIDEDCSIEVSHEKLTFSVQSSESYVTAEYTFTNPESHPVTSRLVFPFGSTGQTELSEYQITVDQQSIPVTVRHTYKHYDEAFDEAKDLAKLHDSYKSDDFFSPDLPVTHQIYRIDNVDFEKHNAAFAAFEIPAENRQTLFYLNELNGVSVTEETMKIGSFLSKENQLEIYLIGKPVDNLNWTVYRGGAMNETIEGSLTLVSSDTLTFEELAMKHYKPDSIFLKHDWYNATIDYLNEITRDYPAFDGNPDYPLIGTLMQWYDYEISIEAESSVVNRITAPLVPTIRRNYKPDLYSYSYVLSLAKHFKSFQNLEIEIQTDQYLIQSNLASEFTQSETGYLMTLDALPDHDLTFELCAAQNPKKEVNLSYAITMCLQLFLFTGVPALFIGLFILFFYKSKIQR